MANTSIFDCDSTNTLDLPRRQIISYGDDDDLFAFDCDEPIDYDEIDNKAKNLSIRVTIDNTDGENSKRKRSAAFDSEDDDDNDNADDHVDYGQRKKRISNVATCSRSTSTSTSTRSSSAKNGAETIEQHAKPVAKSQREPYKLIEEIGSGTYGKVYKGRCNETQSVIAIKRLKCKLNTPTTVNTPIVIESDSSAQGR